MATAPAPTVLFPVYEGVDMLDVTGPWEMFSWAGFRPVLVAQDAGTYTFRNGFEFCVPFAFRDVAPEFGAIWVPGGDPASLAALIGDPEQKYMNFLKFQAAGAGYVTSVCEGALLLAAAGLLDGYRATTHWAFIPCLMRYAQIEVADGHPRFVLDRNRLTGGGISSGLDEALKLIELLADTETAQAVQQSTQYYPDPPVSSAIPNTVSCPMDEVPKPQPL